MDDVGESSYAASSAAGHSDDGYDDDEHSQRDDVTVTDDSRSATADTLSVRSHSLLFDVALRLYSMMERTTSLRATPHLNLNLICLRIVIATQSVLRVSSLRKTTPHPRLGRWKQRSVYSLYAREPNVLTHF